MKIAISGTTGFVGSKVSSLFELEGHEVMSLTREHFKKDAAVLADDLNDVDAVIHLAGAPIMKRWTASHKRAIYDSRILTTTKLADAMHLMAIPPHTFISASAVGIYPESGTHDERSKAVADNFLGKVCSDWEAAAQKAPASCRTLMFRFGIILGTDGGALKKMLPPFKLGVGGRIGSGQQMMPWIHIEDALAVIKAGVHNRNLKGPVNVCAPEIVDNKTFTRTLAEKIKRPAFIPVPALALQLVFGQGAIVLTKGQRAVPARLQEAGFTYRFPTLDDAFEDLLAG